MNAGKAPSLCNIQLAVCLCCSCLLAQAETEGETSSQSEGDIVEAVDISDGFPSHVPRARWSEDWSRLRTEESEFDDEWLPFKHIPINDNADQYLSFGGEYRFTYEKYDPADRGLSDVGTQDVALHRIAGHADWHPSKNWRVFGQLGVAESSGRDGGNKAGDESELNIWQLFVDGRLTLDGGERVDIRIGRQFIEKYNWLVGAGEARSVRQYYDGFRVAWLDQGFAKFDFYAAEFVDAAEGSFDMAGTDEYFWGTNAEFRRDDYNLSLLYFGWDLKNLQFEQGGGGRHDETRHTLVARWFRPVTIERQWLFDSYLIYQFGNYDDANDSDITAYSMFGEIKYGFYARAETPLVGIKLGYFSGDDDPADSKLKTFYNPIFVTPFFSWARDVMPYNLQHIQLNAAYRFSSELQITLSNDFLWRAEKNDAFYTGASAIGVSAHETDHSYIGSQTELSLNWVANKYIVLSSHLVHFQADDVVEDAGGENQWYARFEMSFLF